MNRITINEALELVKAIKGRIGELSSLRQTCSTVTRYYDVKEKAIEPQYDVKALDKKVVQLRNWLFKAEAAIKQANAVTQINLDADVDALLSPIE